MNYKLNRNADLRFTTGLGHTAFIDISIFNNALIDVQTSINAIKNATDVDIFGVLGMRNLSAFIGELFAKSIAKMSNHQFIGNPHQDGYPDLLFMGNGGADIYNEIYNSGRIREKSPFSPFINGGIEVKATCGTVPTPAHFLRRSIEKPSIGDTRIEYLTSYDWKAHHRETNNLVGIIWDFINQTPYITAVFFGNNLTQDDWGRIVQPREGGGRTTSVSIMPRSGTRKMYNNWIAVINDHRYIDFLNRYNGDTLIS